MFRLHLMAALCLLTFVATGVVVAQEASPALPEKCYLFTSFRGNGNDGLHLCYSTDALHWEALNNDKSFLTPQVGKEKLIRDPCILQGPDGTYHMVWTCSWYDHGIGYSNSKDLIHWSEQKEIPLLENEPTARNCWAPEVIYDPATKDFIIFWATTIPGRFPDTDPAGDPDTPTGGKLNHRIYCTTTKDFVAFTPSKIFFDPGFNVIDATVAPVDGKFLMVFKDETKVPPAKRLLTATSDKPEGPYTNVSAPFSPTGEWVEGPTVLKVPDGYIVYFDMYLKHHYGAMKTKDFKTYEDITSQLSFPKDTRHGTALVISKERLAGLMAVGK